MNNRLAGKRGFFFHHYHLCRASKEWCLNVVSRQEISFSYYLSLSLLQDHRKVWKSEGSRPFENFYSVMYFHSCENLGGKCPSWPLTALFQPLCSFLHSVLGSIHKISCSRFKMFAILKRIKEEYINNNSKDFNFQNKCTKSLRKTFEHNGERWLTVISRIFWRWYENVNNLWGLL